MNERMNENRRGRERKQRRRGLTRPLKHSQMLSQPQAETRLRGLGSRGNGRGTEPEAERPNLRLTIV